MPAARAFSDVKLVNGSTGDPVLYLDYPGSDNAILFDGGENHNLTLDQLGDLEAVFLTHHHFDHFVGLDRVVRANQDRDKTLHIFGPEHTIRREYQRVKGYEIAFFPFQKLAMEVHELHDGLIREARLEFAAKLPEPVVRERAWAGRVCYETPHISVEAVPVDHTAPCWAYALVEPTGYHPDREKLSTGLLRPGPWVQEVMRLLRAEAAPATTLEINGGRFTLGALAEQYFAVSPGARVAFVTDTLWTDAVRPGLVRLAKGAWRLYCDSFYARAQTKDANKYRHMTAPHAAELAKLARVEQLVLMHFSKRYQGKYGQLVDEATEIFPRVAAEL